AAGEGCPTRCPPLRTLPESGSVEPAATAINVDLPAPFSPTRAWTSPATTSKPTPLRATTPGYVLTTSERRRTTRADDISWALRLSVLRDRRDAQLIGGIEVRRSLGVALQRLIRCQRIL